MKSTNHKVLRINCIVDSPSPIESVYHLDKYNLLAVGRSDNSIEIWNTNTWVQLIKIFGTKSNSIRKVFMIKKKETENLFDNLRLFSIGLNGYLIEWSLITMEPKIFYQNPGSGLWDADMSPDRKHCLLACDDGSVRLIRIKKNDLILEKQYSKADAKVLCVKWSSNGKVFYSGLSNGNILKWDSKSGQIILTLNITSSKAQKKMIEGTLIWTLSELSNKYICSGDSKGFFRIWDSEFGVLVKEFKEHEADVLTSCTNDKAQAVYFTGSDSLVCSIQNVNDEFMLISKFRGQSHDINSICLQGEENLLSGGFTTDICIYKLINSRFIEKYDKKVSTNVKRHISAFEQKSKIYHTMPQDDEGILVLHRRSEKLNLWYLNENNMEKAIMLAEINKKGDSLIVSANISKSGEYFAYSDTVNTVLFNYDFKNNDIKKIKSLNFASKFLFFTNDEKCLISLDQANFKIHVYDIKKEIFETISISNKPQIMLSSAFYEDSNKKDKYITFSTLNRNIIIVNLNNGTVDESLPHPNVHLTQLRFLNAETLITVGEDNKFFLVDFKNKKFNEWTNKHMNHFPKNYLRWYNKIMGIASDESSSDQFLLYTDYNYIKIDLNKEIPENSIISKDRAEKLRNAEWSKRIKQYHKVIFNELYKNMRNTEIENEIFKEENEKESYNFENDNFKITSRFSSIIYMGYVNSSNKFEGNNERTLIVIENDWNKILKEFPDTVAKFNYGY